MTPVQLEPIGVVEGGRTAPVDDDWAPEEAVIALDARFGPEALAELGAFSHLEVIFLMHQVPEAEIETGARHPRGNRAWPKVGIFAQRAKGRPNRLGLSRCELVKVEGTRVHVRGLDAIAGTPVLDIKPYMAEFGPRGEVRQPEWASALMKRYY